MIWHVIYLGIGVLFGWTSAFFIVVAHEASRTPRLRYLPHDHPTGGRNAE